MKSIPNDIFFTWIESDILEGKSVQFRVKGNSMIPLLRNGRDKVLLSPCRKKELKPMDVVLFKYGGKYVLHRIIKRDGARLYIQGDGSFVAKEECCLDDVVGKVEAIIRPSGNMISVDSWKWRLPSLLWRKTSGIFRTYLLKFFYRIMSD